MSSKGAVGIYILVSCDWVGLENLEERACWKRHERVIGMDDKIELSYESDSAGYLSREVEWFQSEINDMRIPPDKWTGRLCYTDYDCSGCEDGERVEIEFENGRISSFKQSETRLVECSPWPDIRFDTSSRGD